MCKLYPLAGHKGCCNRVQTAQSYGKLNGTCDCNRNSALEEAAKKADQIAQEHGDMAAHTARTVAAAIRELKDEA